MREIQQYLSEKGIKPSHQRVAIMEYLSSYKTHPSVDEIYGALHPSMPTLSRTTVYNTLKLFVEHGAAIPVGIDDRNLRFDGDTTPHAHFMCKKCGSILDLYLKENIFSNYGQTGALTVTEAALYLKGFCEKCTVRMKK
jgi:Fe2+ or Zn2+ uptake regulation protein